MWIVHCTQIHDGVMDSAHDFDLLGDLVPQVWVSARTLTLLGIFDWIHSHSLLSIFLINIHYDEKIHERQEYAPRIEPVAPIRLADQNHTHYPSCHCTILKKRWLNDGLPAHAVRCTRESSEDVTRTLDAPPSKVHSDISSPTPQRATSQTVESSSLQGAQTRCI